MGEGGGSEVHEMATEFGRGAAHTGEAKAAVEAPRSSGEGEKMAGGGGSVFIEHEGWGGARGGSQLLACTTHASGKQQHPMRCSRGGSRGPGG
jgi:hypothetical protein